MTGSVIGQYVEAWTGPRVGQRGTIVRVDGLYRVAVRWLDGTLDWYRRADLTRPVDEDYPQEGV
jgi:hypothetical protein